MAKDLALKVFKKFSLEGFAVKISHHAPSGTIGNAKFAFLDLVCQKEIMNVNCAGALSRAGLTVV